MRSVTGWSIPCKPGCPDDPMERANHLKAFGYFSDASMVGVAEFSTMRCLLERIAP